MSELTLNTVQGIGDIFWVYQKAAPYLDRIHINILVTNPNSVVQQRSEQFCSMLPKVGRVKFTKVSGHQYNYVVGSTYRISTITRARDGSAVDYAVNAPLEQGVRLDAIDPAADVQWDVPLRGVPDEVTQEEYLCVFVSGTGSAANKVWTAAQWVSVIDHLAKRMGTRYVALIGASWDVEVQVQIAHALAHIGYTVRNHTGTAALVATIDVIRRARYFLGYQSGLNVIAENYGVRQSMVYFPKLRPMMYTWCRQEAVRTRFHASTFVDNWQAEVDRLAF